MVVGFLEVSVAFHHVVHEAWTAHLIGSILSTRGAIATMIFLRSQFTNVFISKVFLKSRDCFEFGGV